MKAGNVAGKIKARERQETLAPGAASALHLGRRPQRRPAMERPSGLVILTGMRATVGVNLLGGGYDYRETVGPCFRGLFLLNPDPGLMSGAPLIYQLHALSTLLLFALWPFSRLVHAWSAPVAYLRRSPILYRPQPAEEVAT